MTVELTPPAGVPLSLFDANTILAADTDNTPAALTVGASTIVGRKATGNIAAMTPAEAKAVLAVSYADVGNALRATGHLAESTSRANAMTASANLTTQRETMTAIELAAGMVVSNIIFAANVAGAVITNQWFTLRNAARQKLAVSGDDLDTAWATQTNKTLFLARSVADAAIVTGTAILTSATAAFTAADVGKKVSVVGAGAAGVLYGTSAVPRTILSVESATSVTLSANAATTVTGAVAYIGTPYTVPTSGLYYAGCMVKAGTMPQLIGPAGLSNLAQLTGLPPILHGIDNTNTGLTTPATAVGTAAALTAFINGCWVAVS